MPFPQVLDGKFNLLDLPGIVQFVQEINNLPLTSSGSFPLLNVNLKQKTHPGGLLLDFNPHIEGSAAFLL